MEQTHQTTSNPVERLRDAAHLIASRVASALDGKQTFSLLRLQSDVTALSQAIGAIAAIEEGHLNGA